MLFKTFEVIKNNHEICINENVVLKGISDFAIAFHHYFCLIFEENFHLCQAKKIMFFRGDVRGTNR